MSDQRSSKFKVQSSKAEVSGQSSVVSGQLSVGGTTDHGPRTTDKESSKFKVQSSKAEVAGQVSDAEITDHGPRTTDKARYVMIGGFLGAGKTTSVARLAQHLTERGLKVGLITN